jgi:hypothetical protein
MMHKRTIAVTLGTITTLISLALISLMAIHPQSMMPPSLHVADSSNFLGSVALARTLPLSLGFLWLVIRRNDASLMALLWILTLVQVGDFVISVAYGSYGEAVGPAIAIIAYAVSARLLKDSWSSLG